MRHLQPPFCWLMVILVGGLVGVACAPSAPASPTAPAKSAASEKPASSPAAVASPAAAGSPAAKTDAVAASKPAASFDEQAVASFYRGKTVRLVVG